MSKTIFELFEKYLQPINLSLVDNKQSAKFSVSCCGLCFDTWDMIENDNNKMQELTKKVKFCLKQKRFNNPALQISPSHSGGFNIKVIEQYLTSENFTTDKFKAFYYL